MVSGRTEPRGICCRLLGGGSSLRFASSSLGGSLSRSRIGGASIGCLFISAVVISAVLIRGTLISGALISGQAGRRGVFRFGGFPRCPSDLAIYRPVHLIGNVVRPPRPPWGATVVGARLLGDEVRHLRRNRQRHTGTDRQTAVLLAGPPALLDMIVAMRAMVCARRDMLPAPRAVLAAARTGHAVLRAGVQFLRAIFTALGARHPVLRAGVLTPHTPAMRPGPPVPLISSALLRPSLQPKLPNLRAQRASVASQGTRVTAVRTKPTVAQRSGIAASRWHLPTRRGDPTAARGTAQSPGVALPSSLIPAWRSGIALLPEVGVRPKVALLGWLSGLRPLSLQAPFAALLARDGRMHGTDTVVAVEQRRKLLGILRRQAEHHARLTPRLLQRVADVARDRWHRVGNQAVHHPPALPSPL
jgi:hypothetical protein